MTRDEVLLIVIALVGVIAVFLIAGWANAILMLLFVCGPLAALLIAIGRTYR